MWTNTAGNVDDESLLQICLKSGPMVDLWEFNEPLSDSASWFTKVGKNLFTNNVKLNTRSRPEFSEDSVKECHLV